MRKRESVSGRGREREGERISSRLHTVSTELNVGLNPTNYEIRTRAKIKSWALNLLSHPGTRIAGLLKQALPCGMFFLAMSFSPPQVLQEHDFTRGVAPYYRHSPVLCIYRMAGTCQQYEFACRMDSSGHAFL